MSRAVGFLQSTAALSQSLSPASVCVCVLFFFVLFVISWVCVFLVVDNSRFVSCQFSCVWEKRRKEEEEVKKKRKKTWWIIHPSFWKCLCSAKVREREKAYTPSHPSLCHFKSEKCGKMTKQLGTVWPKRNNLLTHTRSNSRTKKKEKEKRGKIKNKKIKYIGPREAKSLGGIASQRL